MNIYRTIGLLVAIASLASLPPLAKAQSPADSEDLSQTPGSPASLRQLMTQALVDSRDLSRVPVLESTTAQPQPVLTYTRPTEKTKLRNYLFDAFGPYPIVGAALAAGIGQAQNSPPEWKQGAEAYGRRFGSDLGIVAVTTTTRYGLAKAFKEDTLYYRCECNGWLPRLGHAVISTVTARRGDDGNSVFSVPSLVAPYVGTMTAVYGWYPGRFGAVDAFRMGNYNLLGLVASNIALEFIYGGPHSLLTRMHLNNRHGALDANSNP